MRARPLPRAACVAASIAASIAAGACAATGEDPGDERRRGGSLTVSRTRVAGFEPPEALSGIASFFVPPGPPLPTLPVDPGECDYWTPGSGPTPVPTETPAPVSREAGDTLTLRSNESALELGRVTGAGGQIYYLMRSDVQPETLELGIAYSLEIEGSAAVGALPQVEIPSAVSVPKAVGLYAPDVSSAPALPRQELQIGWSPQGGEEPVIVRLVITGSAGTATLVCATDDDGFYEIAASRMAEFPSGGGILTVSRRTETWSELAADMWLHAEATVTEGGAVTLP